MQRSLRVLHVAETLRGGPATYINNVVATISKPGSTLVLVPDRHAGDLDIDRDCVRVFRANRRGFFSLFTLSIAVLVLVREFQPDIINVHGTFAAAVCRVLLALTNSASASSTPCIAGRSCASNPRPANWSAN